jgi:CBS domain-containing protein
VTTAYAQRRHPCVSLDSIRVAETMHRGIITCRPDATLSTVARLLAAHRIHAVVVAPEGDGDDWGIVSDLDLAAALSKGLLGGTTAGEISSTPRLFVTPDETLTRVAQLMCEYDAHHVIVLGRGSSRPVGIVSTLDLADVIVELSQP